MVHTGIIRYLFHQRLFKFSFIYQRYVFRSDLELQYVGQLKWLYVQSIIENIFVSLNTSHISLLHVTTTLFYYTLFRMVDCRIQLNVSLGKDFYLEIKIKESFVPLFRFGYSAIIRQTKTTKKLLNPLMMCDDFVVELSLDKMMKLSRLLITNRGNMHNAVANNDWIT